MDEKKEIAVIILAAGSIKNKYQSYSFIYNSPALVPIASRSTLSFILTFYEKKEERIYIAINKNEEDLFRKELIYYSDITIIPIVSSIGVSDTLAQVIKFVKEDDIIVNIGTSIPTIYPSPNSVQYDEKRTSHGLYSGFTFEENKAIFISKNNPGIKTFYAFTGIFRSTKCKIEIAINNIENKTDLLGLIIELNSAHPISFQPSEWIDTGHEINYADARKKLISSRSFNAISVNNHTGILTKKSSNKIKLSQEINYVGMLPAELQILYPRIVTSEKQGGSVEMEYYGYPNLSEFQLYRAIDHIQWSRIFESLLFSLQAMKSYGFSIGPKAFEKFYIQKTFLRIEDYLTSLPEYDLFKSAEEIKINNHVCVNLPTLKSRIEIRIAALYEESDFCVMHGDFCFNNILFDIVSDNVKLIDPRGSFGEDCIGIYGDLKYDLAKLLHSTIGNYDYIVNNLFQLNIKENVINYSFPLRDNQETLELLSFELLDKMNANKQDILFMVGLLFLSMCPLHSDNPQRQKLMYAHGLSFVNKYL